MFLPQSGSAPSKRVRFGRYVARRLRRANKSSLADGVVAVNHDVKATSRATEDALEALEDARADRDAADEALDLPTQTARAALAGRSVDAAQQRPYTDIFPNGIDEYIAAPLAAQVSRYRTLRARVVEALPESDTVRVTLLAALDAGLVTWQAAVEAVDAAQQAVVLARAAEARAADAWSRQLERTYGVLVSELGRTAARRFFPRQRRNSGDSTMGPADDA